MRLCDDQPDRDLERFDTAALPKLAELFRGKTGILDHDWSAQRQVARIYDTQVLPDGSAHFIRAYCYMLRTKKNAELIAEIEGGIKKEVSVGCAMAEVRCSICGAPAGSCEHRKGNRYGGKTCCTVLSDPTDAYEFSFVAVPAQRSAGVMKAKRAVCGATLKELVADSSSDELCRALQALEDAAAFGYAQREAAVERIVALGLTLDFGADEAILRKSARALDDAELTRLRAAMEEKAAALLPLYVQLPQKGNQSNAVDSAYLI